MAAPRTTVDHRRADRPEASDWLDVEWIVVPLAVLIDCAIALGLGILF